MYWMFGRTVCQVPISYHQNFHLSHFCSQIVRREMSSGASFIKWWKPSTRSCRTYSNKACPRFISHFYVGSGSGSCPTIFKMRSKWDATLFLIWVSFCHYGIGWNLGQMSPNSIWVSIQILIHQLGKMRLKCGPGPCELRLMNWGLWIEELKMADDT